MRALVTGASGFVGSALVELLGAEAITPVALLRKTSSTANLEGLRYETALGELRDPESLERAVANVDVVFHAAGAVAARSAAEFHAHNVEGTRNLARAAAKTQLKRFVHVSSLSAAGPSSDVEGKSEDAPDAPVSDYGRTKLAGEHALLELRDRLPITIVRPPIVYGPRDRYVLPFFQGALRRFGLLVRGRANGRHKFYSQVHVRDLCRGLLAAAKADVPSGERFYVSGAENIALEDLLHAIAKAVGKAPRTFFVPGTIVSALSHSLHALGALTGKSYPLNPDKLREIAPDYWTCKNEKARNQLGFAPSISLQQGLAETYAWYREHRWL